MKLEIRPKRIKHVTAKPWEFLLLFLAFFFFFATVLFIIDFVPEPVSTGDSATTVSEHSEPMAYIVDVNTIAASAVIDIPDSVAYVAPTSPVASAPVSRSNASASPTSAEARPTGIAESPVRIQVLKVGVDTPILNPVASDITSLDTALLKGAVRYPQSSFLNESGDMLLFGHQSYLPVVHNKAFKAFNDLQELEEGDQIIVYSETSKYYYRVRSIELAQASDGKIEIEVGKPVLTLVTCNSLGAKEDRYVIKADFVSKVSLDS